MIRIGLYGKNGHQLDPSLPGVKDAKVIAICENEEQYEAFVRRTDLDLISICSPSRSNQHADIRSALLAGKHVYAEKPMVLEERQLDELLQLAASRGLMLREMAPTAYEQPYCGLRDIVASGELGEIVQVHAQKSYPYGPWRPQLEDVDGGLLLQVGVHAFRMIEQVALQKVVAVSAVQTQLGNPVDGGELHMAASVQLRLENGGIAVVNLNYLNQSGTGHWGHEQLRIFGTKGLAETSAGAHSGRWIIGDVVRELEMTAAPSHVQMIIDELHGKPTVLLPTSEELHALRVALKSRLSARCDGAWIEV